MLNIKYIGTDSKAKHNFVNALLELIKERDKAYSYPAYRERRLAVLGDINSIVVKALHEFYIK